ncbi:unnamed protein product [Closterium sp. NIES-53]
MERVNRVSEQVKAADLNRCSLASIPVPHFLSLPPSSVRSPHCSISLFRISSRPQSATAPPPRQPRCSLAFYPFTCHSSPSLVRPSLPTSSHSSRQVMTRRGDPLKAADLNRCSASKAASIVILSPQLASRQQADAQVKATDAQVLQTAMALAVLPEIQGDVVAELACPENTMLLGKLHASLMKRLDKARQQHMQGTSSEAARVVTHAGSAATAITTAPSPSDAATTTASTTPPSSIPTTAESTAAAAVPATTSHASPAGQARAASRGSSSSPGQRRRKLVPVETGGMALRGLVDLALQPASHAVTAELLRFQGAEFHFKEW